MKFERYFNLVLYILWAFQACFLILAVWNFAIYLSDHQYFDLFLSVMFIFFAFRAYGLAIIFKKQFVIGVKEASEKQQETAGNRSNRRAMDRLMKKRKKRSKNGTL